MSHSARSIPAIAVDRTMPLPCQKCCRHIICQRCSTRVGSSPINNCDRSSIAPTTLRVCHSSVASPQPNRPGWSVTTFTKTQLRMRAWQTSVSIAVIFMRFSNSSSVQQRSADMSAEPIAARRVRIVKQPNASCARWIMGAENIILLSLLRQIANDTTQRIANDFCNLLALRQRLPWSDRPTCRWA